MSTYTDPKTAKDYLDYTNSKNGEIERKYIFDLLLKYLPTENNLTVLDLGCGDGWLTEKLSKKYSKVIGCDISESLITNAKSKYQNEFIVADFSKATKFADGQFDLIVVNMAAHCIEDQSKAFQEMSRILKQHGKLIMTIPNPYYAYPVGVWKRGLKGYIFGKKPELKLRPFWSFKKDKSFLWNQSFTSYFYLLSEQINKTIEAGFALVHLEDVFISEDSKDFDTAYQLHRYPISLLLKYVKK